jgi:predicted transcriptional regulator
MTVHTTLELDEAQQAELERIARHEDISLDALMTRLAKERLEYDAWFRAEVQKGLDSLARGEKIPHEEAVARMRARTAELKAEKRSA